MQQVLFYVPYTSGLLTPEGVPVYGFGLMLFITFFLILYWGSRRCLKVGLPVPRTQDLAIVLFLTGIAGARVLYMIQYHQKMGLGNKSLFEIVLEFFKIWEGGIVVYGSVAGGLIGYLVFRSRVLKPLKINDWMLIDAIAPLLAVGMALGRVGCFLNGCCWGQVACEECQPVPLSARLGEFPLITAHARTQVVEPPGKDARLPQIHGLQTNTGFSLAPRDPFGAADPRALVAAVEPGSQAEAAGVRAGDRVVGVDGHPNYIVLTVSGDGTARGKVKAELAGGVVLVETPDRFEIGFETPSAALTAKARLQPTGLTVQTTDALDRLLWYWPRGRNELVLELDRNGERVPVAFVPRTVSFFPTQMYETVSMLLLAGVLLAFQPFRRHNGQVIVVLMLGYSAHRFLNEAIRIEPTYALGLTLSQWISVLIAAAAVGLEIYLRATQPKLPTGEVPLGYGTEAEKVPVPAT